MDMLNMTFED